MRYLNILMFILFTSLLAACGTSVPKIKPFKMDIQQGNVVTSKMLLQLRPGMTKSQVRFIMGTPLVVDSFHTNRWDYFYQMRQAGKVVEKRRVILDFDKDVLLKVRGDVVPEGTAGADAELVPNESVTAPKSIETQPKKEEGGLLDKLMFWKKDNKVGAAAKAAAPAAVATPVVAVTPIELPSIEAPAEEAPSMLAVPIALPSEPEIVASPKVPEAKIVAPKVEAMSKADAAKLKAAEKEAAKLEAAQAKAAKKEAVKAEAARAKEAKQEAAKLRAAQAEAAKIEAANAKTAEIEAAAKVNPPVAVESVSQAAPVAELPVAAPAKPTATKACYRAECDNYKASISVSPAVSTKP